MTKNRKIILIIFIILMLIIVLLSFYIYKKNKNKENEISNEMSYQEENSDEIETETENIIFKQVSVQKEAKIIRDPSEFYKISDCINVFINNINNKDNEGVYNLLEENYLKNNNINKEQIFNYVNGFDKSKQFYPEEMYRISSTINIYYSKGYIDNEDPQEGSEKQNCFYAVLIDNSSKTFSIIPLNENEYNEKKAINEISFITKNNYNEIKSSRKITDETMCNMYFYKYKTLLLFNPDKAYELLDNDYKNIRFKNKNEFILYLNEYKNEIQNIKFTKYAVNEEDEYTEYVCQDQYDNYYIFKDVAVFDYTIKMDTYTILTSEFKSEYNNSNEAKKIKLNIYKYINMLNNRDYENAYNLLDDGFKSNYYPSLKQFKDSMRQSLSGKYNIEYGEYTYQTNFSVQNIVLINYDNPSEVINLTVIMQFVDNSTDFKFSFSKNE